MQIRNSNGQLLLPILAVMFFFGMFWITYVLWCRTVYWKMRMDVAADLVALSAARQQATVLNYTAGLQTLENAFLPEIKGYGIMDISMKSDFEGLNQMLQYYKDSYKGQILIVGQTVANANGANLPIFPMVGMTLDENLNSHLDAQRVDVLYVASGWPVGFRTYENAYYTRDWSKDKVKAQPPHKSGWTVCRDSICGQGLARLWLDVDPSSVMNDGGFPSPNASLLRSIGIQCFYPQFNARLLHKS